MTNLQKLLYGNKYLDKFYINRVKRKYLPSINGGDVVNIRY